MTTVAAQPLPADVVIRAAEPADATGISALIGDAAVVPGTLQLPDMAVASRLEMLQRIGPTECRLVAAHAGQVIGMAALYAAGTSLRRQHVRMLAIAVAADWHGRGIGSAMLARLIGWADRWAGVLRIELHVHADNPRARALYERFGFREEGLHRAYALKDGRWMDSWSMARLHPQPPQLPQD